MRLWRCSAFVDQSVTNARFGSWKKMAILSKLVKLVSFFSVQAEEVSSYFFLQHRLYACKSPCIFLRLSPGRDLTAKHDPAVLLDAGYSCSSPACLRTSGQNKVACPSTEIFAHFFRSYSKYFLHRESTRPVIGMGKRAVALWDSLALRP